MGALLSPPTVYFCEKLNKLAHLVDDHLGCEQGYEKKHGCDSEYSGPWDRTPLIGGGGLACCL